MDRSWLKRACERPRYGVDNVERPPIRCSYQPLVPLNKRGQQRFCCTKHTKVRRHSVSLCTRYVGAKTWEPGPTLRSTPSCICFFLCMSHIKVDRMCGTNTPYELRAAIQVPPASADNVLRNLPRQRIRMHHARIFQSRHDKNPSEAAAQRQILSRSCYNAFFSSSSPSPALSSQPQPSRSATGLAPVVQASRARYRRVINLAG